MPAARPALALALALLLAPASVRAQDGKPMDPTGSFDEESKRYEASVRRPALYVRALFAERFARTRDARALRLLLGRYLRPEAPEDHVRYLLAGIVGDAFDEEAHVDLLNETAKRAAGAPDAWLWLQALRLEARHRGPAAAAAVVADARRDPFVRAAALELLGGDPAHEDRCAAALAAIPAVLGGNAGGKLKGVERAALLEASAWALVGARARLGSEPFTAAASLVIDGLAHKKTEARTKLVVARALAQALGADALYFDGEPWRRLLAGRANEAQQANDRAEGATRTRIQGGGAGVTSPRFFGIEGAGLRVAFVVDLSDSMLEPLRSDELEELRRPRTGSDRVRTGDAPTPDDAAAADRDDSLDLPWDRIKTRFDVAREALRRSLQSLGPGMSFAVVVFGTDAEPLLAPTLVRATPQNVQRALAALDAIKPGRPEAERPHGTLRGHTNLHGGLRLAWRLTEGPAIPAHEHVAPAGFATGIDTVFLLSDGAPSWDDFDADDDTIEGMSAGDPETGKSTGHSDRLHYYGPYVERRFLLRDVQRMNLFRRVELHCVGIGEADPELLRQLAELGRGELRTIAAGR